MKLSVKDLRYSYSRAPSKLVIDGLSIEIEPGSYWCVTGPNGSGKSTFLKLACGLLPLDRATGSIAWDGRELSHWHRLELARHVAFVAGGIKALYPVTVGEFVLQGRYAHSAFWSRPSAHDRAAADEAMERADLKTIQDALISEISAGQLQLALIGRALAQNPKALVLDETIANLDLGHQIRIFDLLKEMNRTGLTVILVIHDLNLATEFCPNALWLKAGSKFAAGTMEKTLTPTLIQELYEVDGRVDVGRNPHSSRPKIFYK